MSNPVVGVDLANGKDRTVVAIPIEEYQRLVKDSKILAALYAEGVDNWDWYDDFLKKFEEELSE